MASRCIEFKTSKVASNVRSFGLVYQAELFRISHGFVSSGRVTLLEINDNEVLV